MKVLHFKEGSILLFFMLYIYITRQHEPMLFHDLLSQLSEARSLDFHRCLDTLGLSSYHEMLSLRSMSDSKRNSS